MNAKTNCIRVVTVGVWNVWDPVIGFCDKTC